jgi:MFS family permease
MQVSSVMMVFSVVSMMVGVPMGILTDRVGSKKMLFVGVFSLLCGYILILFKKSFLSFCVFYGSFGLYDAIFLSARESLIYDSVRYLDLRKQFLMYRNTARVITLIALSLAAFMAGKVVKTHANAVIGVDVILMVLYTIVVLWMKEYTSENVGKLNRNFLKSLKNGIRYVVRHTTLRRFFIFEIIWFPVLGIMINYSSLLFDQIFLGSSRVNVAMFGQILSVAALQFLLINVLAARGVYFHSLMFVVGSIVGLVASYFYRGLFAYILIILYFFCTQTADTLFCLRVQTLIPSKSRAFVASLSNFLKSVIKSLMLYVFGYIAQHYSYRYSFIVLFLFYTVATTTFFIVIKKDKHLYRIRQRV